VTPVRSSSRGRLRIAIDLRRMHNTGIGRYARNMFAAVAAEAPEHAYVAVVQNERDAAAARALAPSTRCVVAPAEQYTAREMLRAPALDGTVDLWHSPHPFQWSVGARHRTVLTVLDLTQVTHAIGARNLALREPVRAFMWVACRRADRFTAISATTREQFHQRMGVPLERIHVTPLAPDARFAEAVDPQAVAGARARLGLRERVVLYVGMTQPHKNLLRLLDAMALLVRERPREPAQLAIVGPVVPAERAALRARLEALRLGDHVRFLDWLSDEDVRLAYHAADVVVQPSLSEGFGLTVLEAMQCGTPCVVSDLPVLHEVAGAAAVFVDPLSARSIAVGLGTVLDDSARARELRVLGRANAARFSWRTAARETLAAYEAAVG
jgi:glycosyltransferase involved in cell wall biosynthesis